MSRDDSCPEDARAFARWDRLGRDCGHDCGWTHYGECVQCLKLESEAACRDDDDDDDDDHDRACDSDRDAAWERAQDEP